MVGLRCCIRRFSVQNLSRANRARRELHFTIQQEAEIFAGTGVTLNSPEGWEVLESPGSKKVVMRREISGHKVGLFFMAQPLPVSAEEKEESGQEGVEFVLSLATKKLYSPVFSLLAKDAEAKVLTAGLALSKDLPMIEANPLYLSLRTSCSNRYIDILEPKTKEVLQKFLEGLGIDEALASYIERKSYVHEMDLYQNHISSLASVFADK